MRNKKAQLTLPQKVLDEATRNGLRHCLMEARLVVGVSGGPDSLALLHILSALRGDSAPQTLYVAHLDHGFRGADSEEDARFVSETAQAWGLTCATRRFDVPAYAQEHRLSPEEAARKVRYAFLGELAEQQSATVAVAHTADDQAETVLMNLLRGTGISGLSGMRPLAHLPQPAHSEMPAGIAASRLPGAVNVFRPLLGAWRVEIEEYCAQVGLQPREDSSNADPGYTRNRIRHELLPLLERDYNSEAKEHLVNLSEIAALDDRFIEELVGEEAERLAHIGSDRRVVRFEQSEIARLPQAMRHRITRWAVRLVAGTLEGFALHHFKKASSILSGEAGSPRAADLPHGLVVEQSGGWSLIARRDSRPKAYLLVDHSWPVIDPDCNLPLLQGSPKSEVRGPRSEVQGPRSKVQGPRSKVQGPKLALERSEGSKIQLAAGWELRTTVKAEGTEKGKPGDLLALFDLEALQALGPILVRIRKEGDFIRPLGMKGSKSLQDLFIDARIPRWVRDVIPVLAFSERAGEVLWAPGPGGRRAIHAPIVESTRKVLRVEFVKTTEGEAQRHGSTAP